MDITETPLTDEPPVNETYRKFKPHITILSCIVAIVLFAGINMEQDVNTWEAYRKWGAPPADDLFTGSWWGWITNNFVHTEIWHIAFNLYWFWILGKKIEFETKPLFYLLLIFSSAFICNVAQVSFASVTGIGLSGIVYSFFGFIFIKSKTDDRYKHALDKRTTNLFIIWLFVCILLTQTKILNIGNSAHIAGLLWGVVIAWFTRFKPVLHLTIASVLLLVFGSTVFWSPFSTTYLSHKAYQLHKDQKLDEAVEAYQLLLERNPDDDYASSNLKGIQIYKLGEKAVALHKEGKYEEAKKIYLEILKLDKDNKWAQDNLKLINEQYEKTDPSID